MGTRDPTTPQPIKLETGSPVVERHPVQRKDPGMNAEKLNIRAPPPPPPSPTRADNLVSPFLVTDHPSRKPAQRPPAENIIQSPFLVDPTKYPFAEEPIMFDLEDVLMESEIYPLAPPKAPSEEFPTPQDRPEPSQPPASPTLPSMADMISELTGLALAPSPPPPQQFPSPLLQDPAEGPISRPQYVVLFITC